MLELRALVLRQVFLSVRLPVQLDDTVEQLTGNGVAGRAQCAARATNDSSMSAMHQLLNFIGLDAYLGGQGLAAK